MNPFNLYFIHKYKTKMFKDNKKKLENMSIQFYTNPVVKKVPPLRVQIVNEF